MKTKSYVITGASSCLGKTFAKYLCKTGNKVVLTSRRSCEDLSSLQSDSVLYLPGLSLVEENDLDVLCKEVGLFFERGFHVINCLGYFPDYKSIESMSIEEARNVLESNVLAVFGVANRLLPLMSERGGGHFVGFSMHTAYQNYPYMALFSAAKMALESFIKGISNEYLKDGINANVISLSTLQTEHELRMKPHGDYSNWLRTEEVCKIVTNLIECSSGLVNGSVIHAYKYSDSFFGESFISRIRK